MVKVFFIFCVILSSVAIVAGLRFTGFKVPPYAIINDSLKLWCKYDLGQETMYSQSWYKDGTEFYRYIPSESPAIQTFPLDGVMVDMDASQGLYAVTLRNITKASLGAYRCSVSTDSPSSIAILGHVKVVCDVNSEESAELDSFSFISMALLASLM